jgi:nucleoside-diphosphate-sugar epimerase
MKTILLTGVAGFIGQKTTEFLLRDGWQVVGVDNINNSYDIKLKEYRIKTLKIMNNFTFINMDIENRISLNNVFKNYRIDTIINLAARAGVRNSLDNPYIYLSTNLNGTLNLLDLAKDFDIEKLVLASTSSIYAGEKMPFIEETCVNRPLSPYAASKKAAELMAYTYHYNYNIDITVVRYFTVYGPAGRPDMSIFRFIKWIDEEKPLKLYGDGSQSRDFTYIDDIAEGNIKAIKRVGYEIINLGGGTKPVSLNKIITIIENLLGKRAIIEQSEFKKTDLKETMADISKAKNLLNWEPKFDLKKGIKNSVEWYIKNKRWLKLLKV